MAGSSHSRKKLNGLSGSCNSMQEISLSFGPCGFRCCDWRARTIPFSIVASWVFRKTSQIFADWSRPAAINDLRAWLTRFSACGYEENCPKRIEDGFGDAPPVRRTKNSPPVANLSLRNASSLVNTARNRGHSRPKHPYLRVPCVVPSPPSGHASPLSRCVGVLRTPDTCLISPRSEMGRCPGRRRPLFVWPPCNLQARAEQ